MCRAAWPVQTDLMRPTTVVLGVLGAAALGVAAVVAVAIGDLGTAGWVLVGPAPFFGVGLFVALRRPDRATGLWCLVSGTGFLVAVCLGDVLLRAVGDWPGRWLLVLFRQWADYFSVVGAIGLFGWFPDGRPRRPLGTGHQRAGRPRQGIRRPLQRTPHPGRQRLPAELV